MASAVKQAAAGVDLERRQITVAAALTLLGGATITLGGCGGGGGPSAPSGVPSTPPPTQGSATDLTGKVLDPEHTAVITAAQLAAGGALVLEMQTTVSHTHTVELTSEQVRAIGRGERVLVYSSEAVYHYHVVTFDGVRPASDATAEVADPAHRALIMGAQLNAGGALDLDIRGNSDHGHIVSLQADEVVAIRQGRRVQKFSTMTFQHDHQVTFN